MQEFSFQRRRTRKIRVGLLFIGGDAPISVQSMTKTKTSDIDAAVEQIRELAAGGCDLVRCAVPDEEAARALKEIKRQIQIPLVADIHFDYRLALLAVEAGVDKIRLNPGNIGERRRIEAVLKACQERGIPIRIGINSGSIEPAILQKYGHPTAEGMVESALHHIRICEAFNFHDIIISLKATSVPMTIQAYRLLARQVDYPFHVGVTEAGPTWSGTIKSAIGIGTLLAEGIGDTIRVSLSADPLEELRVGKEILKALGLRRGGVTIISCPTCGRLETPDLVTIARQVEERTRHLTKNLTVAIMGCAVNGPGEAREADLGVACGKNEALLFRRGKTVGKLKASEIAERLYQEILDFPEE